MTTPAAEADDTATGGELAAAGSASGVGAFSVEDAVDVTADVVTGEPTAACADVKQQRVTACIWLSAHREGGIESGLQSSHTLQRNFGVGCGRHLGGGGERHCRGDAVAILQKAPAADLRHDRDGLYNCTGG